MVSDVEATLEQMIAVLAGERIMLSTESPHPDSKCPHAVDSFRAPPDVRTESERRTLWDYAFRLYELDSNAEVR